MHTQQTHTYTCEMMVKNFINIVKEVHLQIPEAQDSKQDKLKENHT